MSKPSPRSLQEAWRYLLWRGMGIDAFDNNNKKQMHNILWYYIIGGVANQEEVYKLSEYSQNNSNNMTLLSFRRYIESLRPTHIAYSLSNQDRYIDDGVDWELLFDSIYVSLGQRYIILSCSQGNVVFHSVKYVTLLSSLSEEKRIKITCQCVLTNEKTEHILIIK